MSVKDISKKLRKIDPKSVAKELGAEIIYDKLATHPVFEEGDEVNFNITPDIYGSGLIRGKAINDVVDLWIVEVKEACGIDEKTYKYSCICVPHTLLERKK